MTGRLYIDDIDVYSAFGLYVEEQGYNGMLSWARRKDVEYNDWHEEDGIEPDLSTPALDSRKFTLKLCGATTRAKAEAFIGAFGGSEAYHTLNAASIGRSYIVRMVGSTPIEDEQGICRVNVTLADDFPMQGYVYQRPASNVPYNSDYMLDSTPTTSYGVRILEGARAALTRTPDIKPNLTRSISAQQGVEYHSGAVRYKDYDATLPCLMRANSLDELWRNYDALLYDIMRPGSHSITSNNDGKRYPYYYLSSEVTRFYGCDKIWLEFNIHIKIYTTPVRV